MHPANLWLNIMMVMRWSQVQGRFSFNRKINACYCGDSHRNRSATDASHVTGCFLHEGQICRLSVTIKGHRHSLFEGCANCSKLTLNAREDAKRCGVVLEIMFDRTDQAFAAFEFDTFTITFKCPKTELSFYFSIDRTRRTFSIRHCGTHLAISRGGERGGFAGGS